MARGRVGNDAAAQLLTLLAVAHMRILVGREKIEHGTQLSLFEQINGYRYQVIATATRGAQVQRLEARHRVHARVEGFIRCGKDTGLSRWPSHSFAINTAWSARSRSPSTCCAGCGCCTLRPAWSNDPATLSCGSPKPGPGHRNSSPASTASALSPDP
ncbi:hypothetical protein BB737_01135 [Mycobacterium avium subsp. hominissuis]|uniref:Transposase n=1 Tax=Mycobacterium avium subsp. hominissuis TaxID=439334 RepID=A0A2A3LDN4_MYCAV|nr:hypothetical protein [Mycobacterium avium]ATO67778.1 hypothetical protein BJP78_13550 [Mycobacterium avium subsp. hominissuis]PBJ30338.1 hypothetical protein BI294_22755 [Mycobacterium avium subsp. hominissuis]PBJ40006.1 hypothetical protein XV03_02740 [Mycobacterium avium subsp. hominissuis]PBJ67593.1 hypothetical protein BB737_01135 [Mycobacterium avium subsp. hominissuis]QXD08156.1 hypothetical protein BB735_011775 [Mycobacterium avium subsp. hominissuis]